jgi:hypothetical protein
MLTRTQLYFKVFRGSIAELLYEHPNYGYIDCIEEAGIRANLACEQYDKEMEDA